MKKSNKIYLILAIGLMTVGQVPAGIYLPSMISMGHFFNVTHGSIQYILGVYLLLYGASQLLYGPLSDHFGRKPTAILGLIIFGVGCLVSIFSQTIVMMYLGSAIQGFGLGSVAVVSTAVLRDLHNDKKLLFSASYLSAATIVTPLISPIIGSYLQVHFGWHATFIFMLIYALLILWIVYFYFSETNQNIRAQDFSLKQLKINYSFITKSPHFLSFGFCRVLAVSGGTAYAANSPFLFQTLLHLSPVAYAWISVIPASGFFIGSFMAKKIGSKERVSAVVSTGAILLLIGSASLLLLGVFFPVSILGIVVPMIIYMLGSGIIYPSAITGAILPLGTLAGTATALVGSCQNLGRGFFSSFVGYFHAYSTLPLAITITTLSFICVLISATLKNNQKQEG